MSFSFRIRARGLPVMDKGLEGSSADPYFKLYVNDNKIYQSKVVKNTLNPDFKKFKLDRDDISDTPMVSDIKIVIKDDDWGNKDDIIGECYFKIINQKNVGASCEPLQLHSGPGGGCLFIKVDESGDSSSDSDWLKSIN